MKAVYFANAGPREPVDTWGRNGFEYVWALDVSRGRADDVGTAA